MNDFTKEELNFLYKFVYEYIEMYGFDSSMSQTYLLPMAKKIDIMRVNYCDHDMQYASGEFNYCDKCGYRE